MAGQGAVFDVYLPAVDRRFDELAVPTVSSLQMSPQAGARILVMDDEEMVLKVMRSMLQALGYEVVAVEDGSRAIEVYREAMGTDDAFAAVIFDLTVPGGMSGEEAVVHLREIDPSLKAIVSSGYSRHAVMAAYKQYGFDGVVVKPYRLYDLSNVLQEVLT